jgi:transposase
MPSPPWILTMLIFALDLGSTSAKPTKTFATLLDTVSGEIRRSSFPTTPSALVEALAAARPDRVVVEQCVGVGWVVDLCRGAKIHEIQVLNPRNPAWRNRNSKTDRQDANLLAHLSASGQVSTVHVPEDRVRQWRALIDYRHTLVQRRTRVKNMIRSLLRGRGMPTKRLWTNEGLAALAGESKPIDKCPVDQLWRGELRMELDQLEEIQGHVDDITKRLDRLVDICPAAKELAQLDGIGPRSAEAVIAALDDPLRFSDRKKVGAYFGIVPRVHQSGGSSRYGGITNAGDPLVRTMLTQAVQSSIRCKTGWIYDIYAKLHHEHERCPNRAALATVRRIAVIMWAKFRDRRRADPQEPLFNLIPAA